MRVVLPLLVCAGCYHADILLRPPAGPVVPAPAGTTWHVNLIDLFEITEPTNLAMACGAEPVAIRDELTLPGGIINALLGTVIPFFDVWNSTVFCAAGGAPPAIGGPLPPP